MPAIFLIGKEAKINHESDEIVPNVRCKQLPAIIIGKELVKGVMLLTNNQATTEALKLRISQEDDYVISDVHTSDCIYDNNNILGLELSQSYEMQAKTNPAKTLDVLAHQLQDALVEKSANNPPVLFLLQGHFCLKVNASIKLLDVQKELKSIAMVSSSKRVQYAIV